MHELRPCLLAASPSPRTWLVLAALAVVLATGTTGLRGTCEAAQREHHSTQRFPTTPGKRVVIDVADLDVNLRAADVRELIITTELSISGVGEERASSWIENHTPVLEDTQEQLTVTVQPGRSGFLGFGLLTARSRIGVVIPTSVIPDVTTTSGAISIRGDFPGARPLCLRTATGDIQMNGAAASLDVRSTSGDTRIEVVRPLDGLLARTSSGDVTLSGGARKVEVETASGDIWLVNLSGPAHATSSTGKVTLRWDRLEAEARVEARTASSPIHLVLPDAASPRGTLRTVGGTIRSDHPGIVNERGDTVILEGDGPTIEAETASGTILLGRGEGWEITHGSPEPPPMATGQPRLD